MYFLGVNSVVVTIRQAVGLLFHVFHVIQTHASCPMSKTQYSLDKPTIATSSFFKGIYIYMYTNTYYDVEEKIMHLFPSPNELMLSLLSKKQWFRQIHGLGVTKARTSFLRKSLGGFSCLMASLRIRSTPFANFQRFRFSTSWLASLELMGLLMQNPPAPNSLFHRTKETAIGIAVGNESKRKKLESQ